MSTGDDLGEADPAPYLRIAEWLRGQITVSQLAPGDQAQVRAYEAR